MYKLFVKREILIGKEYILCYSFLVLDIPSYFALKNSIAVKKKRLGVGEVWVGGVAVDKFSITSI